MKELTDNIDSIHKDRDIKYGDYADNARLSQEIKKILRKGTNWESMPSHSKETLEQVTHKVVRIICGDHTYLDSWVDIVGYVNRTIKELQK